MQGPAGAHLPGPVRRVAVAGPGEDRGALDVVPGSLELSAEPLAPFAALCPAVGTVAQRPAGSSGSCRLSLSEVFLS